MHIYTVGVKKERSSYIIIALVCNACACVRVCSCVCVCACVYVRVYVCVFIRINMFDLTGLIINILIVGLSILFIFYYYFTLCHYILYKLLYTTVLIKDCAVLLRMVMSEHFTQL